MEAAPFPRPCNGGACGTGLALRKPLPQQPWRQPSRGHQPWGLTPRVPQAEPPQRPGRQRQQEAHATGRPGLLAALAALSASAAAAARRRPLQRHSLRRWLSALRRPAAAVSAEPPAAPAGGLDPEKVENFLKNVRLFRTLPLEEFKLLSKSLKEVRYDSGETVVKQGEPGSCMYIIRSGRATVTHEHEDGRIEVIANAGPGEWFGEYAMLWGGPRKITSTSTTPVKLLVLEREDFNQISNHAQLAVKMLCAVRYPSKRSGERLKSIALQLGLRLLLAVSICPLASLWLYGGHHVTSLVVRVLGLPVGVEAPCHMVLSMVAVWVLSLLLPTVAVAVEALEMVLLLRKAPLWQVVAVEKLAEPLVRTVRWALFCLFAEAILVTCPAGMTVQVPIVGAIRADRGTDRIVRFVNRLFFAVACTNLAQYLWAIKRPPARPIDNESPPNTFGHLVEQYYKAIQHPRKYKNERFADMATTISRLSSGVIVCCGTLPWLRLLGVHPSQVMALGGCGSIAIGFAAKEVLQNLISGMLLQVSKPFVEGDRIRLEGSDKFRGSVRKVGLAYSQITKDDGELLLVPNAEMLKAPTVNRSRRKFRVIRSSFPVASLKKGTLESLCKEIQDVSAAHPRILNAESVQAIKKKNPSLRIFPARCHFEGYGHQGAKINVAFYVAEELEHDAFMELQSEVLLSVNGVLEEYGAEIGLEAHHMLRLSGGNKDDKDEALVHEAPVQEAPVQMAQVQEAPPASNGVKVNGNKAMAQQLRAMIGRIDEALEDQQASAAEVAKKKKEKEERTPHQGMTSDLKAMVSRIDELLK